MSKQTKGRIASHLLIAMAVMCACENKVQREWRKARESGDESVIEGYALRYRNSGQADEAISAIWTATKRKDTIPAYLTFLRTFPETKYESAAREALWDRVKEAGTSSAYKVFLADLPSSPHAADAMERLWQIVNQKNSVNEYDEFINSYGNSEQATLARAAIERLWKAMTLPPPNCSVRSNMTVDVSWSPVVGADSYLVEWSPSKSFSRNSTHSDDTKATHFNHRDRIGTYGARLPMYYRVYAAKNGAKSNVSEPCAARLLPSHGGTTCEICGDKSVGFCHLRGIFVCLTHNTFTDDHGQGWQCP